MHLPRMTTRRLMIAVAAIGLTLGGAVEVYRLAYRLRLRYDDFLDRAQWHSGIVFTWNAGWRNTPSGATSRRIAYHAAMAEKYRQAARRPWLPVEPDPPPPE
jgi:hypothetical protein